MSNQRWKKTIKTLRWPGLRGNERLYSHAFFDDILNLGWIFVPDLDYFINYKLKDQNQCQKSG